MPAPDPSNAPSIVPSIAHAAWIAAPATRAAMAALEAACPGGSRFVGGCVRNAVMGRLADDIDIATQLEPNAVIAAARGAGLAAIPTGIEHGTITLVADHTPFEVTTLRRDVSTDGRRATVAFTRDWAEDAARRDFRLNALYADASGAVFDPTGGGVADALAGRVIFIGEAEQRIREDFLRILRFFRFNAWYGSAPPDAAGLAACAALRAGLAQISAERIWKELKKTLAAPDPRPALAAMRAAGVWEAAFPEGARPERLDGVVALAVAHALPADSLTRIAAALTDQDAARALCRRIKAANDERERIVAALGPAIPAAASAAEARAALYRAGAQAFADRVLLAWAEAPDPAAEAQARRAQLALAAQWRAPRLPVGGADAKALGLTPGPEVGALLRAVEAWWIAADFPDDRAAALARLEAEARARGLLP